MDSERDLVVIRILNGVDKDTKVRTKQQIRDISRGS